MAEKEVAKKTYKRRTILIKKSMQLRYMFIIISSVLVGFLIFGFEIAWNMHRLFSDRPALLAPLFGEMRLILPVFFIKLAIYLTVVLIVASVISHRMAGPLYKFEKSTAIIAGGDLTHKVYLRKDDNLTDLQKEFNAMVSNTHDKIVLDRNKAVEVCGKLKELAEKTTDKQLAQELNAQADKLLTISKGFKL